MGLNINDIVMVNSSIAGTGLARRNFGLALYITTDATLNPSDPLQYFSDITSVGDTFGTESVVYKEAQLWFAQVPAPQDLMIGRYINSPSSASLTGGKFTLALASLTSITDGSLAINATNVTAIDFSAATSFSNVATLLGNALTTALSETVTCEYNGVSESFIISLATTGAASTLTYATPTGSGTDLSALLLLDSDTATDLRQGQETETITEALTKFQNIDNTFYFITLGSELKDTTDVTEVSTFVVANQGTSPYMFYAESSDPAVLATDDTASIFAQLFAQQSDRVVGDYTIPESENTNTALFTNGLALSSAARLSSIDFSGVNTIINPKFRNRPLVAPASKLTTSQSTELDRKRINRFVPIAAGASSSTLQDIYTAGYAFKNGIWQEIRLGVDWLTNAIQINAVNLLITDPTLSQTTEGQALIKSSITDALKQGVSNGLISPGTLSTSLTADVVSKTNNSSFDGYLPTGYLVYYDGLSTLSEADRALGKLPPYYVWAKGSGKVNFISINLIFDQ